MACFNPLWPNLISAVAWFRLTFEERHRRDARMSLENVTFKIDAILEVATLLLTLGICAAFGFPFIPGLIAFGCLLIAAGGYAWTTRKATK
jgi:hypothetical protein